MQNSINASFLQFSFQAQNVSLSGTSTSEESRIKFYGRDAIQAKYLRIIPLANSYNTKDHPLRIELYGCSMLTFSDAGMSTLHII